MPQLIKRRSRKLGLPPGTLIYIGEKAVKAPHLTLLSYDSDHKEELQPSTPILCRGKYASNWLNVDGLHPETVRAIGDCLHIHPLAQEDILNTDQRPKLEDYGDTLYIVLQMLTYDDAKHEVVNEQVSFVLGQGIVVSFQEERHGDVFDPVRERIRNSKTKIRTLGADFLLYSLMDTIVDHYFVVLEKLSERIESLEEDLVNRPSVATLQAIHGLKRTIILLRKSIWPVREVVSMLQRGESPLVGTAVRPYLNDVYDHTIHAVDVVETLRDVVTGMLDIYLSSLSNRMNEIMKVLTVITTLFMPLGFIAGVYGMNFVHMPELAEPLAYPIVLVVMLVVALGMLVYFKRKRWF